MSEVQKQKPHKLLWTLWFDKKSISNLPILKYANPTTLILIIFPHFQAIFDEFESEAEVLLNSLDIYENTALHISAREGHHGIVELLLKKFATSERSKFTEISRLISGLKNDSEETPLHCAVIKGRLDVVKQLLIFEKNLVYCIDENNNTALHLACLNRKPKIAEELLNFGACVKERNSKQWTPLDCASSVGAVECAKVLLDYDSPLDPLDRAKSTPLHLVKWIFF